MTTSYVSVDQLKTTWNAVKAQIEAAGSEKPGSTEDPVSPLSAEAVTVRALLEGQPADGTTKAVPAGLDALRTAATVKAWAFRANVVLFVLGVVLAGFLVVTTVKGVMGDG